MYEFMKGILVDKDPLKAIVDVNGIGYRLTIPLSTYTRLPACKNSVELFLSHIVREDHETLYAFFTKEERDLFESLLSVSGIGPKTAVTVVGHIDIRTFQQAIATSNTLLLSKIPGIGKKTAERLVIEMRDKFKAGAKKGKDTFAMPLEAGGCISSDALSALINLGYAPNEAQKALQAVLEEKKDETDLGRIITKALKII